jgi:hypothetical protein
MCEEVKLNDPKPVGGGDRRECTILYVHLLLRAIKVRRQDAQESLNF